MRWDARWAGLTAVQRAATRAGDLVLYSAVQMVLQKAGSSAVRKAVLKVRATAEHLAWMLVGLRGDR